MKRLDPFLSVRPRFSLGIYVSALALLSGCASSKTASEAPEVAPPPPPPPAPEEHVPPPVEEAAPPEAEELGVKILSKLGFSTPESIAYDADQDVYFVSNIQGTPTAKDDNGFISKVTPDGAVELKFIDGSRADVTLDAPKGIALAGGLLYVTDIDCVRAFDVKTGAFHHDVKLPGATFVNDIASGPDGSLYVSDSGLKPDFSPSGTDAIYKITSGKVTAIAKGKNLGNPNGVLPDAGGTWVVTFGTGELYWISDKGKQENVQKLPKGKNDGVTWGPDGKVLVSSWEGSSVLAGKPGGEFIEIISGVESPADIGFDPKRSRVLIPLFMKDSLVLHTLEVTPPKNP